MKKSLHSIIFITAVFCFTTFPIEAQNFLWAKAPISLPSGFSGGEGNATSIDRFGNMYGVGGIFSPTLAFNTATLTNGGMFLVKYDPNGNELWVKKEGSGGSDFAWSVTNDTIGNVIISGYFFNPTMVVGSTTLTNTNNPSGDIFLIKYNSNGNVIWAKSAGGNGNDNAVSVKTDLSGNIFMTGYFDSPTITFGTYTLTNNTTGGRTNIFIVKYDTNGNVLWAKRAGGTDDDKSNSVSTDVNGNAFITGGFSSPSIAFGATTFTTPSFFLAKYDANGNVLWAKSSSYNFLTGAIGSSVSTDVAGNAFVLGYYAFDTLVIGTNTLVNANYGSSDIFFAKYDPIGNVIWAKRFGGMGIDEGRSVATYSNGLFITAEFVAAPITIGSYTFTPLNGGSDNMFIASCDFNGNVVCASALGSGGDDNIGLGVDPYGNAYITGDFIPNVFVVGSTTLTNTSVTTDEYIFFAKYSCSGVGLQEMSNNSFFKISPNPNNGSFKLQIDNEFQNGELILMNSLGQKVHEQKIIQGENNIKTNGLAKGLYHYMLLENKQQINNGKIVIE